MKRVTVIKTQGSLSIVFLHCLHHLCILCFYPHLFCLLLSLSSSLLDYSLYHLSLFSSLSIFISSGPFLSILISLYPHLSSSFSVNPQQGRRPGGTVPPKFEVGGRPMHWSPPIFREVALSDMCERMNRVKNCLIKEFFFEIGVFLA